MSDPLSRATRALREKQAAANDAGDPATRDRVLERAQRDGRERRLGRVVLLPIAATFVLFAGWAAATGRLPTFLGGHDAPTESPAATAVPSARPPVAHPPAPSVEAHAAPLPEAPATDAPAPAIPPRAPSVGVASSVAPRASASAAHVPSEEDTLYATAHAAHFDDRDPARALVAWDAYLAKAPSGRLAPEAKYNRALCLVRLGRTADAKAALAPFASGAMGGYRRDEATKLVERLDANAP